MTYLANGDKSFPKERVEVFCGGRVAVLDDFRSLEMVQDGKQTQVRSRLRQDKGHRAEWEAFAAAILAGGPPPIPYEHLFGVTRASFATVESLRRSDDISLILTAPEQIHTKHLRILGVISSTNMKNKNLTWIFILSTVILAGCILFPVAMAAFFKAQGPIAYRGIFRQC